MIRIGHPARVQAHLQKYSLDAILSQSDQKILAEDVKGDMDKALAKMKKTRSKGERQHLKTEMKHLRKELSDRESRAMKETLSKAEVVLVTLTSASSTDGPLRHVPKGHFDVAVIDECSQSLELACWIALIQVKKAVLAGDHLQLPPTIMCEKAAHQGLAFTLMERVIAKSNQVVRMLKTQYRMHQKIMQWSSSTFYENHLKAHESVQARLLQDLDVVSANENTEIPLLLIDTTGCDMFELVTDDEQSKANEGEAALVTMYAEELIASGLDPSEIAVITPYNLQVEFIRMQLREKYPSLEIRSVDGFQGREKEAVILSLVRSNPKGEVGFLAEARRLNVAVTRAKRQVVVIANVETVSHDKVLKGLMEYLEQNGEVRSAMQYEHIVRDIGLVRPENLELTLQDTDSSVKKKQETTKPVNEKKNNKKTKKSNKVAKPSENEDFEKAAANVKKQPKRVEDVNEKSSEEKALEQEQKLQKIIDDFLQDETQNEHHCSPDLTSYERMKLHEFAEKAQLSHASEGDGKKRHIVLKKVNENVTNESDIKDEASNAKNQKSSAMVQCFTCSRQVPKPNIELHKLKCTIQPTSSTTGTVPKKSSSKSKKQKKHEAKIAQAEDDIDKLLEAFDKIDNVCNGEGCKVKIATLGVTCEYCRRRFCMKCGFPEAHGCGEAAKIAARQQISRDGKLYPGSGRPNFKPDANRKAALQRKLDKKLGEMQDSRKKTKPGANKDK